MPTVPREPVVRAYLCTSFALLALAGAPSGASAQSVRLDQYRMAETPEDGFVVSRPDDLGHLRFGARLDVDYALNPLVYQLRGTEPGTEIAPIVEHLLAAQLGLSFGLFDRLVISASVPFNLVMDGVLVDGQPRADGTSVGDVSVGLRGRLFGEEEDAFALALQVTGTAPTANAARFQSRFAGEGSFTVHPELLMEVRIADVVRITGNVGALVREEQDFGSLRVGHELTWALGVYVGLVPDVLDLSVESWGSTALDRRFGESQLTPVEGIAGLRVQAAPGLHLGIAAGTGIQRGYGAGDFRGVLSVGYATPGEQGPGDRDADGLNDQVDRCPDEPEDDDDFQDDDGCPDPDNDGDGILDADDQCRDRPEDMDGLADEDGCPEDDADGDGAADESDRCPTVPGMALASRPECTGCPTCDETPPPEPTPAPVEPTAQTLPDRVYFETGRHGLIPGQIPALERVLRYMQENPSARVQVEGHADFRGDEPNNVALSQQRAQRVMAWLQRRGVARSRMVGVGCGETYPADDNETRPGRRANRRVEFHVIGGSSSVRGGCVEAR